jgi:AraC family L-rhamnose operon transcriptional activator RhaR
LISAVSADAAAAMSARLADHPYIITSLEYLLPTRGLPLFSNRPRHQDPTPFHDHDFLELAVVHAGDAVHQGIHGERPISRGDVVVLHPGQWHGYARCLTLDLTNLCVPTALFTHELAWLAADPLVAALLPARGAASVQEVIHVHADEVAMAAIEPACARLYELVESRAGVKARAEMIALVAVIIARLAGLAGRRHVPSHDDDVVLAIASKMSADLARPWKLSELARRAGMTREHFCRRFRRVHGTPPLTWLTARRAERAAVLLLSTDAAVADVGRRVGWDDPNYCARRFRAAFGVNPAAYRRRVPEVIRG